MIEHKQKEIKMLDQFTLGESKLLSGATEE
jgi:hypothetical protein